ncbi:hypothetical protein ACE6H2_023960 [Prunus campanulata]
MLFSGKIWPAPPALHDFLRIFVLQALSREGGKCIEGLGFKERIWERMCTLDG